VEASAALPVVLLERLLGVPARRLAHGGRFTGRPVTRVRVGEGHVAKMRPCSLEPAVAYRRTRKVLERERTLHVHHPAKTWFVAELGGRLWTGNVTPELLPLHVAPPELGRTRWTAALAAMWQLCFATAARYNLRLDESLSNFALDPDGNVFYLDDDLYPWDRFVGLAQSLGAVIRRVHWLKPRDWRRLGRMLRERLRAQFADPQSIAALASQVDTLVLPDATQMRRCRELLAGLRGEPRPRPRHTGGGAEPLALLADVHGNWPALESALRALRKEGISRGIVLGDTVGYGPEPLRCIEAIAEAGLDVIKGNHDHAVASGYVSPGFSADARWVIEWTRARLPAWALSWLDDLPSHWRDGDHLAVHGSPVDQYLLYGYVYDRTSERNLDWLARHGTRVCFHGHSHMYGVYARAGSGDTRSREPAQTLTAYRHCLVCPGAVGQPRSGQPGAEFAIYDPRSERLTFHRLPYDVAAVERAMLEQGFPPRLGRRLHAGR